VFCLTGADVKIPFQRRTAQQGRTIKIRCEVTGEDFLRWETPSREASLGVPQLQAENITAESTGRVRLERIENYYLYLLRIEDVRVSDGGNYTCIGSKQSSSFTLEVDFVSHRVTTPQLLKNGENGTIELAISAFPPLHYEWRKDGKLLKLPTERIMIDPHSGTLHIFGVEGGDQGNYTCRVVWKSNRPHEETEDTVTVEIVVMGEF
ncbi:unnamed protein product, partial [Porites evermanni]